MSEVVAWEFILLIYHDLPFFKLKRGSQCKRFGYFTGSLQLVNVINKSAAGIHWENQLGGFVGLSPRVAVPAAWQIRVSSPK
jgi:hypothetical protein